MNKKYYVALLKFDTQLFALSDDLNKTVTKAQELTFDMAQGDVDDELMFNSNEDRDVVEIANEDYPFEIKAIDYAASQDIQLKTDRPDYFSMDDDLYDSLIDFPTIYKSQQHIEY